MLNFDESYVNTRADTRAQFFVSGVVFLTFFFNLV